MLISTGDNYAFAVMEKEGKRIFDLISFFHATNIVNEAFKKGHKNINSIISNYFEQENSDSKLLFLLKQNNIVYLPQEDENIITDKENPLFKDFWIDKQNRAKNIYTVVKFSKKQIYFLKHDIAYPLVNKVEFGSQNCYEKTAGISIKDFCIKIEVDRLGNISLPSKPNNYPLSKAGNELNEPGFDKLQID